MADRHFIISRIYVWLTRWNRCRGFGIQSPNDYAFVRDVVNEHRGYYGYEDLKRKYPGLDAISRKKGKLLLRLANFLQPKVMVDAVGDDGGVDDYIHAGCARCKIRKNATDGEWLEADLLRFRLDDGQWMAHVERLRQGAAVIVEPASGYSIKLGEWKCLVDRLPFGICYDLYYCGIIIFDKNRYKQNYIINF